MRLAAVGAEPVAWAEGDVLTIAVRQSGKAPSVVGFVDPMPGLVLYQPGLRLSLRYGSGL